MGERGVLLDQIDILVGRLRGLDDQSLRRHPHFRTSDLAGLVHDLEQIETLRAEIFGQNLFQNFEWRLFLELIKATCRDEQIHVISLCASASIPQTSALRRVAKLERAGLITRHADQADRRRATVGLSRSALAALGDFAARCSVRGDIDAP